MARLVIPPNLYKKLIENIQAITILAFIKENEDDRRGVSKDGVAREMHEKQICSRPTTIKIIDSLLLQGILVEGGRGTRNASDLVVSKDFDFEGLMKDSFQRHYEKLIKSIDPFKPYIRNGTLNYNIKKEKGKSPKIQLDID